MLSVAPRDFMWQAACSGSPVWHISRPLHSNACQGLDFAWMVMCLYPERE